MALSVYSFDEQCVPPINLATLAYHPSDASYFEGQTNLATSLYSLDGIIGSGDKITVPAQCGGGMDIVFLVDYTGSMGNAIDGVKSGLSNILSTIDTESVGNYRVGFCLFDEYSGNLSKPTNYGDNSAYTSLPQAQKVVINSEYNHTQFITCMAPLGNVGDSSFFQTQLNKIDNTMPLGNGDGYPEPGGLGINEIISNEIAGSFRSDAIKVIVLITDSIAGGYDDTSTSVDATYLHNLRNIADSLGIQIMIQSSLSISNSSTTNYNSLINTTPAGRYDQVSFDSEGDWINTGLISGIQSLCDNSFTPTCIDAPIGWYHNPNTFQSWYYDGTTVNNVYNFTPQYSIRSSYYRQPHLIGTDEDNKTITWIVDTQYVSNGTTLYWNMNTGDTTASDFIENKQNGSFTINNNTGQFSLTTKNDFEEEGIEQIVMTVRTGSVNGTIIATENLHVDDSSTPVPTATPSPTAAPPVINNFRGVEVGSDEIETLWSSVTGATGNLTITWGINGSYTNVGSGTSNQKIDGSFNLENLSPNTVYYIRMTAANVDSSTSANTVVKTAAVLPTATPVPQPTATKPSFPTPTPIRPTATPIVPTPTPYSSGSGSGTGSGTIIAAGFLEDAYTDQPISEYSINVGGSFNLYMHSNVAWRLELSNSKLYNDGDTSGPPYTDAYDHELGSFDAITSGTTLIHLVNNANNAILDTVTVTITSKYVVECVSGMCIQGTGRVASSSKSYSPGDVVSLNNIDGCWEVLSTTNATAVSSITGACASTPTPTPSYYVYKMDPCDGVSAYVNARSNSPITIGNVYRLTGSGYADQSYTAIQSLGATSFSTYVGLSDSCDTDGGGPRLSEGGGI
ncbi:hypothetical protein OAE73_00795 [bacterium]|nr:hypothetical protein [bacterium]